jgi:hypothetical protein
MDRAVIAIIPSLQIYGSYLYRYLSREQYSITEEGKGSIRLEFQFKLLTRL